MYNPLVSNRYNKFQSCLTYLVFIGLSSPKPRRALCTARVLHVPRSTEILARNKKGIATRSKDGTRNKEDSCKLPTITTDYKESTTDHTAVLTDRKETQMDVNLSGACHSQLSSLVHGKQGARRPKLVQCRVVACDCLTLVMLEHGSHVILIMVLL